MLTIDTRIARTERLLRMLEQDAPLLATRVAPLAPEHRQSAMSYANLLRSQARRELEKLLQERRAFEMGDSAPHPAD
jgi:hypothetical protein